MPASGLRAESRRTSREEANFSAATRSGVPSSSAIGASPRAPTELRINLRCCVGARAERMLQRTNHYAITGRRHRASKGQAPLEP